MLCHGLDFDDTHADSICHVGVVVSPAAVAVAEAAGSNGRELLLALVAGSEIITRIGAAAAPGYMVPRVPSDVRERRVRRGRRAPACAD